LSVFQTELFSPYWFSLNKIIPSLGHLLILGILAVAFSTVFYRHFPIKEQSETKGKGNYLFLSVLLIGGVIILCGYQWIFSQLVSISNINFETYKVLELNIFSITGFASVFLLMLVPVFYLFKIFQKIRLFSSERVIFSIIISLVVPVLFFHSKPGTLIPLVIFYCLLVVSTWISTNRNLDLFSITVVLSLICGVYFLYFITILSEKKITENLKIQAVSFSTENDPEAEHLLLDLWPLMEKDTSLANMMKVEHFNKDNVEKITNYLEDNYFTGFWKNYHVSVYLCRNDQPLQFGGHEAYRFVDDHHRQHALASIS